MTGMMSLVGIEAFEDRLYGMVEALTPGRPARTIGSPVSYSIDQEFGTRYQRGTPHLRPAMQSANARFARLAADADDMDDFLDKIAQYVLVQTQLNAPVDTGHLRDSYRIQVTRRD